MTREEEKLECEAKYRRYIRYRLDMLFDDQAITPMQFVLETARAWRECELELYELDRKWTMASPAPSSRQSET